MRISILHGPFLPVPEFRGAAVAKAWFQLGAEFAARGHAVTHVSRLAPGLAPRETRDGVAHVRVPSTDRPANFGRVLMLDLFYAWRAARQAPDADVTVTNTFWAPVVLGARHGAIYVDVQRMPKGQMKLYRRAARLRANSAAVAAAIAEQAPQLISRVRVVPNPLPFTPGRPVDWAKKSKMALFVGRVNAEKGIELLLEAWKARHASSVMVDWILEIVGPSAVAEGGGGEEWARGLQQRFASRDIVWRGPIFDPAQLNETYERASVFVYPSLAKGETFGVAVLEAMAWGCVPVVSSLDCFRDFVRPGVNGMTFAHEGGTATRALVDALGAAEKPSARVLAENAVRVRETHASAVVAEQLLADFAALTSQRSKDASQRSTST
jgi:glycosyltransferase involved in cell wall biosynthesis